MKQALQQGFSSRCRWILQIQGYKTFNYSFFIHHVSGYVYYYLAAKAKGYQFYTDFYIVPERTLQKEDFPFSLCLY